MSDGDSLDAADTRIGPQLRAARLAARMTMAEVAEKSGLTKGFVSKIERDLANVSVASLMRLCEALGISVGTLFRADRGEVVRSGAYPPINFGGSRMREYLLTPSGEKRFIAVTVSPVPSVDGSLLGVACLINDRSELERVRRQQALNGEISAEMALQLRTSLATISGYAQQLANSRDSELAGHLASDIAHEAVQLEHSLGGFLTRTQTAQAAAAGGSVD